MKFSTLLAPMTADEFLAKNWGRAPALLRGRPDRFAELGFDLEAVRRALPNKPSEVRVKAQFFDSRDNHREMAITASQIQSCFDAGMTICLGPVEVLVPDLEERARTFARSTGFAGHLPLMCYWSPRGAGFGWHFDDVGVFICQIRGSKRWWYSRAPAVECPAAVFIYTPDGLVDLKKKGIDIDAPRDSEMESVFLEPGDMLYLPAGTWHRTVAEREESVAVTIGTVGGGAASLVEQCLGAWMRRDGNWSRAMPFVEEHGDGRVPPAVERELSECLARLKAYVGDLTVNDLVGPWLGNGR